MFEENQLKGGFFPFQIDANAEPKFALNAPWCSNMSENQLLSVGTSFAHSTGGSIWTQATLSDCTYFSVEQTDAN